jgi:T4 bacteriophage base plate protein
MLPKIDRPTFDVKFSIGKTLTMRPMVMKEEKILLMAKQSESREDVLKSVRQIVNNCIVTEGVNIDSMSLVDLEWAFIKLRAASVSNKAKASFRDQEDDKVYDFDVDLNNVDLKYPEQTFTDAITVGSFMIKLRHPPVSMYIEPGFFELGELELLDTILINSMATVFEGDKATRIDTHPKEEIKQFIDNLPSTAYADIQNFYKSAPTLYYKIEYTNSKGTKRIIELTTLDDFFMFV